MCPLASVIAGTGERLLGGEVKNRYVAQTLTRDRLLASAFCFRGGCGGLGHMTSACAVCKPCDG